MFSVETQGLFDKQQAVLPIVFFIKSPRQIIEQILVVDGQFHGPRIILHGLLEHLALAQRDAEFIEKVLVLEVKSGLHGHQLVKHRLGLFLILSFQIDQPKPKNGTHVGFIDIQGPGILHFRRERLILFAVLVSLDSAMAGSTR